MNTAPRPLAGAATVEDVAEIGRLLAACGLAADGVAERVAGFIVAREAGRIVACACLDDHGDAGLIRSVAVAPDRRRRGLARALVEMLLDRSRRRGHQAVYLLTATAAGYFARLGFRPVERARVRPAVLASDQLRGPGACTTSTIMALEFDAERGTDNG